jgi:mono/diheme cytochrome c family protein
VSVRLSKFINVEVEMNIVRKVLKIAGIVVGAVVLLLLGIVSYAAIRWDARVERPVRSLTAKHDSSALARGEFLYKTSIGCWQCHSASPSSPPSGGMKFDLTGLTPSLGTYYAANITPDIETGIGAWTDGEIVRAIREGVRHDGGILFPIMPVDPLSGLSDDDALAIVSYLRTLPPVRNAVPKKEPSLFAKTLITLGVIGPLKEQTTPILAPQRAVTAEYGAYVARHASLCSDCHTPRNLQDGSFYYDSLLAGSSFRFGDKGIDSVFSYAANITPDNETGIGKWSEEEFIRMLRTGTGPDGKVRTRHMPYSYYGLWDTVELKAVYKFIRTLQPVHRTVLPASFAEGRTSDDLRARGAAVFNSYCVTCHGHEGKGAMPTRVVLAEVAPSLSDDDLMEFISEGNLDLRMPSFGKTLSHDDLKAVATYIRSWKPAEGTSATY